MMTFRFHAKESVRDGVRRIGLEQIDLMLIDLRAGVNATRIHDLRKRCKMLRALLHLARGGIEAEVRRSEMKRWREIAGQLERARDAAVRLDTFRKVVTRPDACRDLARRLESDAEAAKHEGLDAAGLKRLTARINAGRRLWARLPLKHHGWRLLEAGLRESYREARQVFRQIDEKGSDEDFHKLRKRVKALWYHLHLLGKVRPKKLKALGEALEEIGDLLGVDHDLAVLRGYAAERDGRALDVLDPLVSHRRGKVHRKVLTFGRPLFRKHPRDFIKKMKGWWREWHG